ncbi:DUF1877 family protein [Nocardia sp. NPDC051832]|uniref:DUF1877 family protein n=1 Tax=Nocardia sp. NPDC051832 TaxID=3155673 RepID=UPI00341D82B8
MHITMTAVNADTLAAAVADPQGAATLAEESSELDYHLSVDDAWHGVQYLLDAAEVEVSFRPEDLSAYAIGTAGVFGIPDDRAAVIESLLRATPFDDLAADFDGTELPDIDPDITLDDPDALALRAIDELVRYQLCHELLLEFFADATAARCAVILSYSS